MGISSGQDFQEVQALRHYKFYAEWLFIVSKVLASYLILSSMQNQRQRHRSSKSSGIYTTEAQNPKVIAPLPLQWDRVTVGPPWQLRFWGLLEIITIDSKLNVLAKPALVQRSRRFLCDDRDLMIGTGSRCCVDRLYIKNLTLSFVRFQYHDLPWHSCFVQNPNSQSLTVPHMNDDDDWQKRHSTLAPLFTNLSLILRTQPSSTVIVAQHHSLYKYRHSPWIGLATHRARKWIEEWCTCVFSSSELSHIRNDFSPFLWSVNSSENSIHLKMTTRKKYLLRNLEIQGVE